MQVSWIDPEEMRELVNRLRGGDSPAPRDGGWELHTLPDAPPAGLIAENDLPDVHALWGDGEGAVIEKTAQREEATFVSDPAMIFAEVSAHEPEDEPEHEDEPPITNEVTGAAPELDRIRQKLQAIRDKAEEAGLLAHTPEPAVEEAPVQNDVPMPEEIVTEKTEPPVEAARADEVPLEKATEEEVSEVAKSLAPPQSLIEAMQPDTSHLSHESHLADEDETPAAEEVEVIPPRIATTPREEDARVLSPFKLADYLTPAAPDSVPAPVEKKEMPVVSVADSSPPPVQRPGSIWGVQPKKPEDTQLVVKSLVRQEAVIETDASADKAASTAEVDTTSLSAVVLPNDGDGASRMVIEVPPPVPRDAEVSFEIPLGAMPDRLQAFSEWAMRRVGTQEFLIVDSHGDVLWGRHVQAGLVVSTMLACTAALRSSAIGAAELLGVIEQPVPGEKKLSVIPCQTCYGLINLAIVRRETVEEPEAALLRRALIATIEARAPGDEPAAPVGAALD
jgi:hypothetical protein